VSAQDGNGIRSRKAKHGTLSGYAAHYYYKDLPPCEPCKEANRQKTKAFHAKNPGYHKQKWKEFKEKNPNYKKDYHKQKPEQSRQDARRRRARKRDVESGPYTEQQVLDMYGTDCHLCLEPIDLDAPRTQGKGEGWERGLHIDHLVPISKGGSNTIDNVRPAHGLCNLQKGIRWGNTQGSAD
jgi:5-methylcytosine-specific restriction endonuclease McrA